ncbi:MAG: ABC transporter ATP-binding protein [Deltaproteobacteria bacterium]|nr:ABC transporter ATP-binding protein [Deltaproteobacteria bacterium]MBW1920088.1 ABC transporter ATP-binding protein [Deltaproteobacteria bacterium]MBW1934763.1 ABC transporter ATP-binding protein [Deltaproteobacteria bacterium]MBW2045705.1 ABC transporter ATP-binding protein [Deltaproteobacteria bacterium]RLB35094.1 MAG: ABC transporter ATP-binding protein [Deltaproteobacteria bacterium]
MLEVKEIHTFYGLSHILFGVSLNVDSGQVVCLLGRNGAGKTTTLKSILGMAPPRQGQIFFKGEEVTGKEPYIMVRKGVGYVPDDRRIFADLTVGENLEIAARKTEERKDWDKNAVYELFPRLREMDSRKGGFLSGGEQKMLAIGRALMGNPEFLLLDEPTEGLAPVLVRVLRGTIERLKGFGLTVLLAEQNVKFTLRLSDYGYIIEKGQIAYKGTVKELTENEEVRKTCGIQ